MKSIWQSTVGREFLIRPAIELNRLRSPTRSLRRVLCDKVPRGTIALSTPLGVAALTAGAAALGAVPWVLKQMKADVRATPTEFNLAVLSGCVTLQRKYRRFPLLFNGHLETIWGALMRRSPNLSLRRETLGLADGGVVTLDWDAADDLEELPPDAPILILMAGLAGGSDGTYVQYAMCSARKMGMRAVSFNSRGTAGGPLKTPQFYSASFTGDLRSVVAHLQAQHPSAPLLAMGWSLGANILVNYLGEEGQRTPVMAAVSLVNPFNLTVGDRALKKGVARIYDRNLGSGLSRIFRQHAHLFEDIEGEYEPELAMNARTVRDFDSAITRVSFGWKSVDAYYEGSGSYLKIPDVQIPLLCIQGLDDPIAVKEAIPYRELENNPNCVLVTTPTGGHLGWVQAGAPFGAPWADAVAAEWLKSAFDVLSGKGPFKQLTGKANVMVVDGSAGNGSEQCKDTPVESGTTLLN